MNQNTRSNPTPLHLAQYTSTTTTETPANSSITVDKYLHAVEPGKHLISALYIHVPFCFHKCHYCDFFSIVDNDDQQPAFVEQLIRELDTIAGTFAFSQPTKTGGFVRLDTIFIGGGTPTLLKPALLDRLLGYLQKRFIADPDCSLDTQVEVTIEANPETLTPEIASVLNESCVSRVSIGAQSFNQHHLKTLERWHHPDSVAQAVNLIRDTTNITNLSLDLIFGIPGQSHTTWADDLKRAIALKPQHMSCYNLTYEPHTKLTIARDAGRITPAPENIEVQMLIDTRQILNDAGLSAYEVSNFATQGYECRHNIHYWRNHNWIGAGPSASSHVAGCRWTNTRNLDQYLHSHQHDRSQVFHIHAFPPISLFEHLPKPTQLAETIMLGLRLTEGINIRHTRNAANDINKLPQLKHAMNQLVDDGLVEVTDNHWRLTDPAGILLTDSCTASLMHAVDP